MATVEELQRAQQNAMNAGAVNDAEQIGQLIRAKQREWGPLETMGGAAVRGATGIADLLRDVSDVMGPGALSRVIRGGGEREEIPRATEQAVESGLTFGSSQEIPEEYRIPAAAVETFTGAMTPGGVVAAPFKMGANLLAKKGLTKGLGFLGREAAMAGGAAQGAGLAEAFSPEDSTTRAIGEVVGGTLGGPVGAIRGGLRGLRGLAGKAGSTLSGFKAAPGSIDELSEITTEIMKGGGAPTSGLKDLFTRLSAPGSKINSETRTLLQSLAVSDPAKAMGSILNSTNRDELYEIIAKQAARGKAGIKGEVGSATFGSVIDDSLRADGSLDFSVLKNKLFGGRRPLSSLMLKHGIVDDSQMQVWGALINKAVELGKAGAGPDVMSALGKDAGDAMRRIGILKMAAPLTRGMGAGQLAASSAISKLGKYMPNLLNFITGMGRTTQATASQDAIKLRGYLAQALSSALEGEEEQ